MSKGITLVAIGDPAYGKFAFNMAMSLKAYNNIPIQLIYEEKTISHLSQWHIDFFDVMMEVKKEDCYDGARLNPGRLKLKLYDYLFFDETIYLDVDGLCIKNIEPIFEMCKDGYYFTQVVGEHKIESIQDEFNEIQWATISQMIDYYHLKIGDVVPAINSSFQYIKKDPRAANLYQHAIRNFESPIPNEERSYKWGRQDYQPDELYMDVALAQIGLVPKMEVPLVIYFDQRPMKIKEAEANFYLIGLYGGRLFTHQTLQTYYDKVVERISVDLHQRHQDFKIFHLMKKKIST